MRCSTRARWRRPPHLVEKYDLPLCKARVHLAEGNTPEALAILEAHRQKVESKGWEDERLKAMVLQSLVHRAHGDTDQALRVLAEALELAEPAGFVRIFVDEGPSMARLLSEAAALGIAPDYTGRLLASFGYADQKPAIPTATAVLPSDQPLIEPLSQRELEILALIAEGLSNHEIGDRLYLALSTVKGHNRNIFGKLQVQRRTEAVARARDLGLV